jgi:hypothetical protein
MRSPSASLSQTAKLTRYLANIARPREPLFFLSHTRSFSSLLCHILNSNPEVDGYGELWIDYRTPLDLYAMRYKIALTTDRLRGRYTLDKLLHNKLVLDERVLVAPSTRVMIGIREPEGAVRSILASGRSRRAPVWKRTAEGACNHYIRRVERISETVRKRSDVIAFPTDALLTDTGEFLAGLGGWLELKQPLTPEYDVGPMTGKPRFGDTSWQIKSGAVQTERPRHDFELPRELLEEIWDVYNNSLDLLFTRADHVLCGDYRVKRTDLKG